MRYVPKMTRDNIKIRDFLDIQKELFAMCAVTDKEFKCIRHCDSVNSTVVDLFESKCYILFGDYKCAWQSLVQCI